VLILLILWGPAFVPVQPAEAQPPAPSADGEGEQRRGTPVQDLNDIHSLLFQANQAYLEGRYEEAKDLYSALVDRGHMNGHVFFNLGNAYIRLGETGKAILSYKRAALLLPRDGDLKANLQYARSLTQDRIEEEAPSLWHTLVFWYFGMNLRELWIAFLILQALFWASAVFNLYRDSEWAKWGFWLSLMVSLILLVSAAAKTRESFWNKGGVILAEECPVRAGFSRSDTTLFVLHEGAEFTILDEEKGWWKIALADGKKGWVTEQAAGRVAFTPQLLLHPFSKPV
jgi:tetratricopeptide (TPR) repeat protein